MESHIQTELALGALPNLDDTFRAGDIHRHRFFQVHVLARGDCGFEVVRMKVRRGGDDNRIHVLRRRDLLVRTWADKQLPRIERPVPLRLLQLIEVCVCGEMSGDPIYAMLLLGLGLRQLSMTPQSIPEIKKVIRSINIEEAKQVAQEAMRFETARDVNNYLREQTRRILPEVVVN